MCPHKRAFVLDHGIIGDDVNGNLHVSCPYVLSLSSISKIIELTRLSRLHKRNFRLDTGDCTNDAEYKILAFDVKEVAGNLLLLLPPPDDLDAIIGSSKWMVKQATAEIFGRNSASAIEIVGPKADVDEDKAAAGAGCGEEPGTGVVRISSSGSRIYHLLILSVLLCLVCNA